MNIHVPVRVGGANGVLIELSACHARVRHGGRLAAGSETTVVFDWGASWFVATARVGSTEAAGEYELQFLHVPPNAKETLDAALQTLKDERLRLSVGDIIGEALARGSNELLRYRFISGKWIVRTAKPDEQQPVDGFLVPAQLGEIDRKRLCAGYEQLDNDGRQMLRLLAAAKLAA
jgi:hypothetical protein